MIDYVRFDQSSNLIKTASDEPERRLATADRLPMNCLSVFDHFVGLALKGLKFT